MKNTVRIHRNGGTKAVSPQSQIVPAIPIILVAESLAGEVNASIDTDLKEKIAGYSLDDRKHLANRLRNWVADLDRSNAVLEWIENQNSGGTRNRN